MFDLERLLELTYLCTFISQLGKGVSMNIVVCIKQVPDSDKVSIDRETNRLNRAGVPSIINPFDENALEMALQLKDLHGGKVIAISMGPPQAEDALRTPL